MQFIVGNGEVAVLAELQGNDPGVPAAYREPIRWNAAQLHPGDEQLLKTWPRTLAMEIDGIGKVLFCHATPQSVDDIFTRLTPDDELIPLFDGCHTDVVVCGHTHMQFDRTIGPLRVVNSGSIGMPFGNPGAYWLLLGPRLEFRRTDYDLEMAAARIRETQYPGAAEFAQQSILSPPSEEKMLAAFGVKSKAG